MDRLFPKTAVKKRLAVSSFDVLISSLGTKNAKVSFEWLGSGSVVCHLLAAKYAMFAKK